MDEDGRHLRHGAAPSLPDAFVKAIDGLEIGPSVGSCGTAMYRRETVVVADILQDPLWRDFRALSGLGGVRSCWSSPILAPDHSVLGSFAVYHRQPHVPDAPERSVVELATSLAGIAIQRWRGEEALRQSEQRLSGMLANLHLVALMLDREARLVYCNDHLLRLTGWTREEVIGRSWFEVFVPPGLTGLRGVFDALLADDPEAAHHENEILTRFGNRRVIRWNNTALRSPGGDVIGTASIGEDITEQKRVEEQLRQSQKMDAVGRLAGGVAHDFNNILGVISGHADMLKLKLPAEDPNQRRVEQILSASERAAGLTKQLLAFSRKQVLEPTVLRPSAVLSDMKKMLEPLIGEDVDLTLHAAAEGAIRADKGQLEQVLMNLVVNARDAMPKGGELTIETRDVDLGEEYIQRRQVVLPGRYVMMSVSDTGHGMDEATQARIFEPFFTTKPKGQGTGLGLATVYGIVKQSDGYVWVYSEPGEGTVFRVYLPRVADAAPAPERPRPEKRRHGTETLLVVEDEPAALELICEVLRAEGYVVLPAANGQDAVEMAARYPAPLHLLLTDVILPKLSGPVVAEHVRRLFPDIKVLFMSGYTDDRISHHGVLDAGVRLLQKPFTGQELLRRLGEVLDA
jgi:PAS domain S-box-containing protein